MSGDRSRVCQEFPDRENFRVPALFRKPSRFCCTFRKEHGASMKPDNIERNERQLGCAATTRNKGSCDADILVLLWEVFKTRASEIDHLLDLSLSILASVNDFPQKAELEAALKKALSLVRT
jgi:hypothetical protein